MSEATHARPPVGGNAGGDHAAEEHEDAHHHATRRGYLIGFGLSVVLTAIPFWLVMAGVLSAQATTITIVAFAVLQIGVHTVSFLHVNPRAEGGWTLMAYVFTAVLVIIVLAGSLWIMYHLNTNMMPMPGHVEAAPGVQ